MQIETCEVGRTLRLGNDARIVFHTRQGARVGIGVTAPVGTELSLGGTPLRPISGTVGRWSYLFSLCAIRRFSVGAYDVQVWLPGELIPLAADCDEWLHVGIDYLAMRDRSHPTATSDVPVLGPAPTRPVASLSRVLDGCRPLFGSACR
jgi:hypothetical protein